MCSAYMKRARVHSDRVLAVHVSAALAFAVRPHIYTKTGDTKQIITTYTLLSWPLQPVLHGHADSASCLQHSCLEVVLRHELRNKLYRVLWRFLKHLRHQYLGYRSELRVLAQIPLVFHPHSSLHTPTGVGVTNVGSGACAAPAWKRRAHCKGNHWALFACQLSIGDSTLSTASSQVVPPQQLLGTCPHAVGMYPAAGRIPKCTAVKPLALRIEARSGKSHLVSIQLALVLFGEPDIRFSLVRHRAR